MLATPSGPSADNSSFKFTRIASGLQSPVYLTDAGDGSGRLFIVEQTGRIRVVKNGVLLPTPFLDIRSLVASGGERGLLSVAFHPQFKTNGVFIVDYTRASSTPADVGDTVIARYTASPTSDVAVRTSGRALLTIKQPQANHNGGLVKFGPDGHLYIGMGDGGAGGDVGSGHAPEGNGQSLKTLLGKILRIEVAATGPYTIPGRQPRTGPGVQAGDLGLRRAQPVAIQLRPSDRRPLHRRRRAERMGGDRLPARRWHRRRQLLAGRSGRASTAIERAPLDRATPSRSPSTHMWAAPAP